MTLFYKDFNLGTSLVYNRHNPYYLYFVPADVSNGTAPSYRQVALFPIIPSVSKAFKF